MAKKGALKKVKDKSKKGKSKKEADVAVIDAEATEEDNQEVSLQLVEANSEEVAEGEEAQEEKAQEEEASTDETVTSEDPLEDEELEGEEHDRETLKEMLKNPKPIIEALLFSSPQPLPGKKLKGYLRGAGIQSLPKLIEEINQEYEEKGVVWRIEEIAGGYVMMTLPDFSPWVRKLQIKKNDDRLSQAALESLAVVAYRQPITRAEVDAVRGVSSGSLLKTLIDKGLLRIAGQAEIPGRPLLYGTTQKFLDVFGLSSLRELPKDQDTLVS